MADESERLKILEMIDKGQISAQDGIRLLNALSGDLEEVSVPPALGDWQAPPTVLPDQPPAVDEPAQAATTAPDQADPPPGEQFAAEPQVIPPQERFDPNQLRWRSFWWIPMWVGVGITLVAALLMFGAWNSGGFGFWFACTWFPFILGVAVMALAWASRTARWLHVRIHQKPGETPERISISLPIPLRLTAWFLRIFGKKIPQFGNTGLDELIMALDATSPDAPFYVEVNEGKNGERVEVYIG